MFKVRVDKAKAASYLKSINNSVKLMLQQYIQQVAIEYFNEIKDVIQNQKGKWVPLTPDYQRFKSKYGLDPRTLIATGAYQQSITIEQVDQYSWKVYPKGKEDLAEWLEFGTSSMPSRIHWRLAAETIRSKLQLILQKIVNQRAPQ